MKAILARFMSVQAAYAVMDSSVSRRGAVVGPMKRYLRLAQFRILLTLAAIGSSALVLEAGRRWS